MNDIYSFYQLISKYQIEIPIIQRDYAQGRNNPKAADVRKSLVGNMIKAVKEGKLLFFDFVYGRVDNNKFIPFDGQQRLTTLFLFHKYVFEKCQSDSGCNHKDNCFCRGILGRFSYATRQSSREFCKKLVENNIIPDDKYKNQLRETFIATLKKEDNEKERKADEFIKSIDNWIYRFVTNQPWFYPDWEKDPTVMGMLTMLDEIHCQMKKNETDFKTSDFKKFAEKLTSGCNCPITFHFVDMGEHKMSDETYVKMNARGKTLTPFENFKASLEQYLEDKRLQDLQNRLKNKIDGDWLDLFWNINGNVLPDTLMMSFFNRHFMNVWRCWYANPKSEKPEKKEEYDTFNTRIQKEMPLYPTKDNFVSFEIYSYVLDKCGVDECLTPIFNIWDALCEKDNSILSDCQAVWNCKEEVPKWNLYQGDKNNNNRETYPSRVAFFALMKYFSVSTATTSLAQWMRVVWNIIENSRIDDSEPYHAALSLIENLSSQSHSIYNALANDFDSFNLGSQYHAKDQVAEEIAKAKKIIEDSSWEELINDAERCPYLLGKIWVLFQNGEQTSKELFGKRYFILKSILDNQDTYYLPKILLSYYNKEKPELNFELKKTITNWKKLLTDKKNGLFDCFQKIESDTINPNIQYQWIKDIAKTNLLNCSRDNAKIVGSCGNSVILWGTAGCKRNVFGNEVWGNVIIGNHRTILVDGNLELQNKNIVVPNTNFVSYFDVNFRYNNHCFQWYGVPNGKELDVYLMEDEWANYIKRPNYEEGKLDKDNHYCFRVTQEMESDTSLFTNKLDCLIAQAYPNESDKTYCVNCQSKICD